MVIPDTRLHDIPLHKGPGETGDEFNGPQLLADPVGYFTRGYREWGPIFRTRYRGGDWVTIAGIEANDFLWQNTSEWSYQQAGSGFGEQFGPTYVTQLDGAAHLRKRRLLKAGFSADAIGGYVSTMAKQAGTFLERREAWSDDANEWLPALLLSLNAVTLLKTDMSPELMRDCITLEGDLIYGVSVSAHPAEFFAKPGFAERKARVFGWVGGIVDERLAGLRKDDNLQALIDQDSGGLGALSREELVNDAYMLLVAGIHNTARLTTHILERLSLAPEWVAGLRIELGGYGPDSFARGLSAYPYLKATIFESERLHPGGAFLKRRPLRDLEFSGRTIPAGTKVLQAHALPHFLEEYFPDPRSFNPARWLDKVQPPRKALVDFGGGSHVCLGMNLTRIQVPIVLAALLTAFEWTLGYAPVLEPKVDSGSGIEERHEPIRLARLLV